MPGDLNGVRLKIKRADDHRTTLEHQAKVWVESQQHEIVHEHNRETGEHFYRVRLPAPPDRWAIILGELAHNLRSALDHLVYQLVINNGVTPPDRNWLQFPIYSDAAKYKSALSDGRGKYLVGVTDDVRDRIADLQPGNRRKLYPIVGSDPLEVLAALNDTDKHRILHPCATVMTEIPPVTENVVTALDNITSIRIRAHNYIGLPVDQAVLFGLIVEPPTADIEVKFDQTLAIGIAFGEGRAVPIGALLGLVAEIERIVGIFDPLF
ncbi:MAG TPA: hypothetical protein VGL75_02580 [Acidothermaceae bacterium]